MKNEFEQVIEITSLTNNPPELHLAKLIEEVGELAQEINKTIGIKTRKAFESEFLIKENIKGEIADTIQILFAIANCYGLKYDEIVESINIKNDKWLNQIND